MATARTASGSIVEAYGGHGIGRAQGNAGTKRESDKKKPWAKARGGVEREWCHGVEARPKPTPDRRGAVRPMALLRRLLFPSSA